MSLKSTFSSGIALMPRPDALISVITAATPGVFGFDKTFRKQLGQNYTDVAISEEHAVAFASGLAKNGAKPILAFVILFTLLFILFIL